MPSEAGAKIWRLLVERYGHAPPADESFEDPRVRFVWAYLNDQVPAGRAGALLEVLRDANLLEPDSLAQLDQAELIELARQAGAKLSNSTAATLRRLAAWLADQDSTRLPERSTDDLREELRAIKGLGPGLVDQLIGKVFGRAVAPLDRAAYRVLSRHGLIDCSAGYDEAQSVLNSFAPDDPLLLSEVCHGLRRVAREHCRTSSPQCSGCPLEPLLPPGGPIEPDS